MERSDVVVIGAGLTGLLTGVYLARAGVAVCVLEAEAALGAGETGRSLGQVEQGVQEHPHRTIRALGDRIGSLFSWTDRGKALLRDEGLFEPCGALWIASRPGEDEALEDSVASLDERRIPAELWDAARVEKESGATGLGVGLWMPGDGRLVPDALERLVGLLEAAGGTLKLGQRVTALTEGDGVVVQAPQPIEAEAVVMACGAGVGALDPRVDGAILPVREQGVLLAGQCERLCRAGQGWTAFGPSPEGKVITGCRWASPHMGVGETEPIPEPRVQQKLEAFAVAHLGGGEVLRRWGWLFAQSRDMLPIVGPMPGDPRRVVAVGFGPNGLALGAAAARTVADGLIGTEVETPWLFSSRRLVAWR